MVMQFSFEPAVKQQLKLRLALTGVAGSGKTFSALAVGTRIAALEGGECGVIDTEHDRAKLYAGQFAFRHLHLPPPYSPDRFIGAMHAAVAAGFKVIVIDSLSHAWMGEGGVLQIVDDAASASRSKSTFSEGWRKGTPEQNKLIEAIMACPVHLIACMRSKTEYSIGDDRSIKKLGMAPVQREGVDYEFDIVGDLIVDGHRMLVSKSRMSALEGKTFPKPGADFADQVYAWLNDGASAAAPAPAPARTEPPGTSESAERTRFKAACDGRRLSGQKAICEALGIPFEANAITEAARERGFGLMTIALDNGISLADAVAIQKRQDEAQEAAPADDAAAAFRQGMDAAAPAPKERLDPADVRRK